MYLKSEGATQIQRTVPEEYKLIRDTYYIINMCIVLGTERKTNIGDCAERTPIS